MMVFFPPCPWHLLLIIPFTAKSIAHLVGCIILRVVYLHIELLLASSPHTYRAYSILIKTQTSAIFKTHKAIVVHVIFIPNCFHQMKREGGRERERKGERGGEGVKR